ncbi:16S rRNA (adenine(1518)-N(6)/adenine(1519)-N(6))-dimethyltransferase RsmA [Candidatus Latescibacterota bacterium]
MLENHRPKKRLGQHFLVNGRIADRIVDSASIGSEDIVLEIGPGKGILTGRLLNKSRMVFAVEIDPELSAVLRKYFGNCKGFRLVEADILGVDLPGLLRNVSRKITVVSNLPYNISTPVIEYLIKNRKLVERAVLMVQKEVACRYLAQPGSKDYGLTTLNLALCARGKKIMDVKPGSFNPPPEVMSSVVTFSFSEEYLYPLGSEDIFRTVTGAAFRQRRKMVHNTLIPYFISTGIPEPKARELLISTGINPRARPESLEVEDFVKISNAFEQVLSTNSGSER